MNRSLIGRGMTAAVAALACASVLCCTKAVWAQSPSGDGGTRAGRIVAQQQEKARELHPYEPNKAEIWVEKLEEQFITGSLNWYPYFTSAYSGGGFTLGAGYRTFVGDHETVDVRGSYTLKGYKRVEAEFRAPRLFDRRGTLSVVAGWREATDVGFYGLGTAPTSKDDRVSYSFRQPWAAATLNVRPARNWLAIGGGAEYSQWEQRDGGGNDPSVEEIYTPDLPGLNEKITYLHLSGEVAADTRPAPGYARRGGYYAVAWHGFADTDDTYSFSQVDYEAVQHLPLFRETWVLSFRGKVVTTFTDDDEVIPFFMLPALGGGSSLRGFSSWRFRDRHSLLLQAEWRVMVDSILDVALFYDAGKVTDSRSDLDLDGLKSDYGIGFRFHGPMATPLRVDLAKSNEGLVIVFAAQASF